MFESQATERGKSLRVVFMAEAREVWGAEVSMLTLAAALREQGVEVALVCLAGELAREAVAAGITTYIADAPAGVEGVRAGRRLWRTYIRHMRGGDRLVLFAYILVAWAPVFRPVVRRRNVRIALDLHDQLVTPKAYWAVRATSRAVDSVVACSAFTASQLGHRVGVYALHRPVMARPAVDQDGSGSRSDNEQEAGVERPPTESAAENGPGISGGAAPGAAAAAGGAFTERGVSEPARTPVPRPFRVGIVGRISPEKHHHVLTEAVSLLGRPAEMVVRGAVFGPAQDYATWVFTEAKRLLGDRFVNEGRVPAAAALNDLDTVVVANPAEPMGRTVLEAQTAGVIAVVPDTGGSAELVKDGETGLRYRAGDPVDLAGALRRLIDRPELREQIRARAPSSVPRPQEYARAYLACLG